MVLGLVAGLASGLLLGLLVGLSMTPVVAGVVSAVTALATGFLAVDRDWSAATLLRISGLGLGATAGILVGVQARAHSWLSPTPSQAVASIVAAGYTPEEARRIVAYERYGFTEGGVIAARPPGASGLYQGAAAPLCQRLLTIEDPAEIAAMLRDAGGGPARLAPLLADGLLRSPGARRLLCEP